MVLFLVDRLFRLLRSVTPGVWIPVSVLVVEMLVSVVVAGAGVLTEVESVVLVVFALVSYSFS